MSTDLVYPESDTRQIKTIAKLISLGYALHEGSLVVKRCPFATHIIFALLPQLPVKKQHTTEGNGPKSSAVQGQHLQMHGPSLMLNRPQY